MPQPSVQKLGISHNIIFQQDNALAHTAKVTKKLLAHNLINVMFCPGQSPGQILSRIGLGLGLGLYLYLLGLYLWYRVWVYVAPRSNNLIIQFVSKLKY